MSKNSFNKKITSCTQCDEHESGRDYTSDSFEYCEYWKCNILKVFVRRYVDWHDSKHFIPDNCPHLPPVEPIINYEI